MKSRFLLNVVVAKGTAILKLLSSKDETLLIRRDPLLILNLGLDVVDGVRGFYVEGDRFAGKGFHKDLHSSTEAEHQVEGGLLLDVIVAERAPIFKLFPCENETLLIRWDTLLILDLSLDVVNGVRGFDIKSDGLARKGLHENLRRNKEGFNTSDVLGLRNEKKYSNPATEKTAVIE